MNLTFFFLKERCINSAINQVLELLGVSSNLISAIIMRLVFFFQTNIFNHLVQLFQGWNFPFAS